jgi:hypothetical protein
MNSPLLSIGSDKNVTVTNINYGPTSEYKNHPILNPGEDGMGRMARLVFRCRFRLETANRSCE